MSEKRRPGKKPKNPASTDILPREEKLPALPDPTFLSVRPRLILTGILFLALVFIFSLKSYPGTVEKYYSGAIYPAVRKGFLFLFNYIPISLGDIIYILIILLFTAGCYRLARLLILKKFKQAGACLLGFILKLEIGIALFYLLWGLNYFRQSAAERLQLDHYSYSQAELISVTSMLIDSVNSSRTAPGSSGLRPGKEGIVSPAIEAMHKLAAFDPPLPLIKPMAKPSLLSPALNYLGTAGHFNPFTGEAQFNDMMPEFTRPFVACHEMAHQMGVGAEDEANFIGFIAARSSRNPLLKYSAYYHAMQEFMREVWRTDSLAYKEMKGRISAPVLNDLLAEQQFWRKYQGDVNLLSSMFYDNYLKMNKQPEGLKTYNRMIILTMAYYKREGFFD